MGHGSMGPWPMGPWAHGPHGPWPHGPWPMAHGPPHCTSHTHTPFLGWGGFRIDRKCLWWGTGGRGTAVGPCPRWALSGEIPCLVRITPAAPPGPQATGPFLVSCGSCQRRYPLVSLGIPWYCFACQDLPKRRPGQCLTGPRTSKGKAGAQRGIASP